MSNTKCTVTALMATAWLVGFVGTSMGQTSASAIAGPNLNAEPSQQPIEVDYLPPGDDPGMWMLQVDTIVDPSAGPMEKRFLSPMDATGAPILLDGEQPFPQPLWEDFLILPVPGTPGVAVTDWHEEISTPGWEWVLPGDERFPGLFPPNESLITRDGEPWPWSPIPMEPDDPSKLWVEFPPIPPDSVLDIHKALLWVGTEGNRIWGDNALDDGTAFDESSILVRQYPTIPEPASMALFCVGVLAMLCSRRRVR